MLSVCASAWVKNKMAHRNLRSFSISSSEHHNSCGLCVGDRVVVVAPNVVMRHLPKFKDGLCVSGLEGEIKSFLFSSKDGVEVSVNRPVLVSFENPKFSAHFEFTELEGASK